ncbi:MAG: hypothetical protein AAF153_00825 [Pseudomonadota bacterium]
MNNNYNIANENDSGNLSLRVFQLEQQLRKLSQKQSEASNWLAGSNITANQLIEQQLI